MGYYEHLCALLEPLQVYATGRGTLSGGELYAAGEALDRVADALARAEREAVLMTAAEEGIAQREHLFARIGASPDAAARREAVAALSRVNTASLSDIGRTLAGCGIAAAVEETDARGTVRVSFPGTAGEPAGYEQIRAVILDLLPCHLAVEFALRFLTWALCEARGWTWTGVEAAGHTWDSFERSI